MNANAPTVSMAPAQPNQSIITGVTVLQEVVTANRPVGSRELARRLGLEHSRVNRVLGTLVHIGMLRQDDARKYSPGAGIHVLSAQSLHASGLIPASLEPLARFQRLGATVALGTVWRDSVCYLLHAGPDDDLAATAGAHETFAVDDSVIGVAFARAERVVRWDRVDRKQVSWAAKIGSPAYAAIAVVVPADAVGRLGLDPAKMEAMIAAAAADIELRTDDREERNGQS